MLMGLDPRFREDDTIIIALFFLSLCYNILDMRKAAKAAIWLALALTPFAAGAITILPACTATGDCALTDILAVVVNFAEFLLGISGAVALLFFIWGGIQMIVAFGDSDKAKKGMQTITRAVWGIGIIFMAGIIVRFTSSALTGNKICNQADYDSGKCIAAAGDSCGSGKGAGLWVLMPGGTQGGKPVGEHLMCIKKDDCADLNAMLQNLGHTEVYNCIDTSQAKTCVSGLCPDKPASFACCL